MVRKRAERGVDRRSALKAIGAVGIGTAFTGTAAGSRTETLVLCHATDADAQFGQLIAAAEAAEEDLSENTDKNAEIEFVGEVPFRSQNYDCDMDSRRDFIADVLDHLHDEYNLPDGAYVNIGHHNNVDDDFTACWGYGGGPTTTYQYSGWGDRLHGIVTYTGRGVSYNEVRQMGMHEFGHLWRAQHDDGLYHVLNGEIDEITPMVSAYLEDVNGEYDTAWEGTGNQPNHACFTNWPVPAEYPHGDSEHINTYSSCTRSKFEDNDGDSIEQPVVR